MTNKLDLSQFLDINHTDSANSLIYSRKDSYQSSDSFSP